MNKKFSWNTTVVYHLPYTLSLSITPTVTIPNYEVIFQKTESQLEEMTTYGEAAAVLNGIKQKFDNK